MANKKITELAELTSAGASDVLAIVDLSGTAVTKKITVANLTSGGGGGDEFFTVNGACFIGQTTERAIPFGSSTSESAVFTYTNVFAIPKNCVLVSVTSASQVSGGSVALKPYKPTTDNNLSNYTELGTVTVANHTAAGTHTFTFDSDTYNYIVGDRFGLSVTPSSTMSGFRYTCLFKMK